MPMNIEHVIMAHWGCAVNTANNQGPGLLPGWCYNYPRDPAQPRQISGYHLDKAQPRQLNGNLQVK